MKLKTVYVCSNCGFQNTKWIGKCPECDAWNSFQEDVVETGKKELTRHSRSLTTEVLKINNELAPLAKMATGIGEFDNVIGEGFLEGSVTLLSGEPGIGKSTLTLQICGGVADKTSTVLYISGEESARQVVERAKRLNIKNENIHVITENNLEGILTLLKEHKPGFIIIDSIQVMYSGEIPSIAGSINQTRHCTETFVQYAKANQVPILIIGHVTKEGELAGPRVLEHLVDTVLFLEGERFQNFRILRGMKNRFGSTNEIGIFDMQESGMQEITNASQLFMEGRKHGALGSAITLTLEGTRPLALEVQALTNTTAFGYPKRTASGFDLNRLQLLAAVLQKHLKMNLSNQDIFINVTGGFKINEPANDLSITMAIASSFYQKPLPEKTAFIGEIGLSGELRSVTQLKKRVKEAEKLGFTQIFTAKTKEQISSKTVTVVQSETLEQALKTAFKH